MQNALLSAIGVQEKYQAKGLGVYIGHACWIADNVIILPGVNVGNGAVIGAGSIVTKDVPAFSVVAGNPAKVLKYRFSDEIIQQLQTLQWWNWDHSKMKRNIHFFNLDLTSIQSLSEVNFFE
jgi:virginiamycin A acetyltransferase